jgi:uncharacterized 2Fe-2S/4Fe-4S cluster protein (DUF4445 family)
MSRVAYAQFAPKKLQTLRAKVLNAVNDFAKQTCAEAGVETRHVHKVTIVGNTCMHHIFLGIDPTYVGLAPYAPVVRAAVVVPASEVPLKTLPRARVCLLPIDRITYYGNAAVPGAQMTLLSETERARADRLAGEIVHVSLASQPDFQDVFVEALRFQDNHEVGVRMTAGSEVAG